MKTDKAVINNKIENLVIVEAYIIDQKKENVASDEIRLTLHDIIDYRSTVKDIPTVIVIDI